MQFVSPFFVAKNKLSLRNEAIARRKAVMKQTSLLGSSQ